MESLQQQQLASIARDWSLTPATFGHKISRGSWIPKHFLLYTSAVVAKGVARGGARIIISAPPRHGKSELASVYVPAWVLERFPDKYVILSSYGADLSVGFGRRVRDIFQDDDNKNLLKSRIKRDASRANAFLTDRGGGMYSVGLGGPITGRGAHVLLIDDYIKEIKEALSQSYRDYVWNWFVTTAFTRLEPGASCIIIATRWHSDDLIGRILTHLRGENWQYIEIPAIANHRQGVDQFGRHPGEALFPERYPLTGPNSLGERKTVLGSLFFEALFQQRPVDETKKLTDGAWLRVIDIMPQRAYLKKARIWDLAATEDGGDFTVGTRMAFSPETEETYIENVQREQLSPGDVEDLVYKTAVADGQDVEILIEQEPGSAGKALIHHYRTNVLKDFKVTEIPTSNANNKVIRAQPLLAASETRKVYLLRGDWNQAFIDEFDEFPGLFDDQVDTAAAGYSYLSGKQVFSATWGRKGKNPAHHRGRVHRKEREGVKAKLMVRGATFGRRRA